MKKIKIMFPHLLSRIFKWAFLVLIGAFIILVIIRFFNFFNVENTNNQILKIHTTKLSMSDVKGDVLPADFVSTTDDTPKGRDLNNNGIRDDVEVAIFKEYPNSEKTRAVLLQYALTLQMEVIQPFINKGIVTEVVTEQGRADTCLSDSLVPRKSIELPRNNDEMKKIAEYINFVEEKQFNSDYRKQAHSDFYKYLGSYGESTNITCDIDLTILTN
ncbi:MAG: hypothetical protein NTU81_01240 [Candidatus Nomurabacteria bacterium]|nr:hypothetical protein [Candidatus Nomurabacteria bacterium]